MPGAKDSDGVGAKATGLWHNAVRKIESVPGDLARLMSNLVYEVSPADPVTFIGVAGVLTDCGGFSELLAGKARG